MSDETALPVHRIVYCKQIDPDTVLHLSTVDGGLVFRRFDGSDPFDATSAAEDQMKVCYEFLYDRPLTPEEDTHPIEDEEWWSGRIAEVNRQLLDALKDD